ncbi:MAG TPA: hypothetical protein VL403_13910, partial [Candidatus Kryptonia bacterium]|nr:hypothetical protein [Candidatus Kryptonia bacterium]
MATRVTTGVRMGTGITQSTIVGLVGLATFFAGITAVNAATPAINLSSGSGLPGDTVAVSATLVNGSGEIVATSNNIVYDASQVHVNLVSGHPDCSINPAIGPSSAIVKSLITALPSAPLNATILRVGVIGLDNANTIPDGLLFTCNFVIDVAATRGDKPLSNTASASDAAANVVVVSGAGATITSLPTGNHLTHAGFEVDGFTEAQVITNNGTCGRTTATVASGLGAYQYSPVNQTCGLGFTFPPSTTVHAV